MLLQMIQYRGTLYQPVCIFMEFFYQQTKTKFVEIVKLCKFSLIQIGMAIFCQSPVVKWTFLCLCGRTGTWNDQMQLKVKLRVGSIYFDRQGVTLVVYSVRFLSDFYHYCEFLSWNCWLSGFFFKFILGRFWKQRVSVWWQFFFGWNWRENFNLIIF